MKLVNSKRLVKETIKRFVCWLSYPLSDYEDKVFILGDGRSGTNWLMEILNFDDRYRVVYEPMHGWEFRPRLPNKAEYPTLALHADATRKQIRKVMRGAFISRNVTIYRPRPHYKGLMIKDVNAHLVLEAFDQMHELKKVLIIRHPFAVAVSKLRHKSHHWPTKSGYFLNASPQLGKLLAAQASLIREISASHDPILNWICVWCILHRALSHSPAIKSFRVVFYEELAIDPEQHLERLFSSLGMADRFTSNRNLILPSVNQLSRTAQSDQTVAETRKGIPAWKSSLKPSQIARGMDLITAFDLDNLYGIGHFPLIEASKLVSTWEAV